MFQVQQLQGSMRDIIQCMTVLCKLPQQQEPDSQESSSKASTSEVKDSSGTQTEIIAVHTPQVENLPFPFVSKLPRPSTLSLSETNEHKVSEHGSGDATESVVSKSSKDGTPEKQQNDEKHASASNTLEID